MLAYDSAHVRYKLDGFVRITAVIYPAIMMTRLKLLLVLPNFLNGYGSSDLHMVGLARISNKRYIGTRNQLF